MLYKKNFFHISVLFLILIFSHFIPFERLSLAPDDYSLSNIKNGIYNFIYAYDRPLLYLFLENLYGLFGFNINLYFYLLIFTNFLNIIIVYLLYRLFFTSDQAFMISLIYIVLYIKYEIYHNSIMIHISLVSSLYLIFLYLLIHYIKFKKKTYYISSVIIYLFCTFWYEIGFFIPLIIFFYNFNLNLKFIKTKLTILAPFMIIMFFYLSIRLTNFYGLSISDSSYNVNFSFLNGSLDIFNHLFGRYAIKNILYGFYQFINANPIYIFIFILSNFLVFVFLYKYLNFEKIEKYYFLFFTFLFLLSVLPILINGESGGRNFIIASVSISYFIFIIIQFINYIPKMLFIMFISIMLIISQGNAWSQVVASRIHNTILESFDKNITLNNNYDHYVFNPISLSNNINYSFFKTDYNLINNYYGFQVWETWGIKGYFNNKFNRNIIIINKEPKYYDTYLELSSLKNIEKGNIKDFTIKLPKEKTFIFDYQSIFDKGYNYGKNE